MADRSAIRFLLGHELQEVRNCDPQTTVLDWLRGAAGRKGTKEGCAEGDCGACTVTVAELHENQLRYRAVNSCIQLLPMLDGRQLISVEDLASDDPVSPQLHPVQQAMVDQHGSQCGFCTPGFVMSLFTLFHDPRAIQNQAVTLTRQEMDAVLAGNLCRCTGYAPIVKAARQALAHASAGDLFSQREANTQQQLQQIVRTDPLALEFQGRRFFAPRELPHLWQILQEHPDARMVAGATDVGLWITKQLQQFTTLVYVGEVRELQRLQPLRENGGLEIGAAVRYVDALPRLLESYPELADMMQRLGAEQVRNAGTIGGNIANGSPIGDMPPALIALDASLLLSSSNGSRELALEDFFIKYGKQDLQPGECVEAIRLPPRPTGLHYRVYKLSRRFDQDISSLCGAFSLRLEGDEIIEPRICFGGMAGTPRRASAAEHALRGQAWTLERVQAAQQALLEDFEPLTDWRGSSAYRMQAAQNLLLRFYLET
ncbi:MAG TPA: xanthine dehydrogenase small subunit, partial [Xanthomonadales bacterium]|nr:xanthine dehydrogenase small subunit [Xanthomonadales bacterium]